MRIYATPEYVMSFQPCYTLSEVRKAFGKKQRATPAGYAKFKISIEDRLWGMIRLWPEVVPGWLDMVVARAITRNSGKSDNKYWEQRAENWLSGRNREAYAAKAVASRSTIYAAYAARAASYAAAYDAVYAPYTVCFLESAMLAAPDRQPERQQQLNDFVTVWKEMRNTA